MQKSEYQKLWTGLVNVGQLGLKALITGAQWNKIFSWTFGFTIHFLRRDSLKITISNKRTCLWYNINDETQRYIKFLSRDVPKYAVHAIY